MPHLILISDGLIWSSSELALHPVLLSWQEAIIKRKRTWFSCEDKTPLEWYAAIVDAPPAALLAAQCGNIPVGIKQCWVASPYSSQLGRDTVRVIPEGLFPWCAEDAIWLCDMLNPLLREEGMRLLCVGAALLLACCEPMDARPMSFARISGKKLPNRHPEGLDGGRLMRLISEIQMALHNNQPPHRSGQPEIHGLWIWSGSDWPANAPEGMLTVATRNPFLQAVEEGKNDSCVKGSPGMMITEAERMGDLVRHGGSLPEKIILAGESHAVLLRKSLLPRFGKVSWIPKTICAETRLLSILHNAI